MSKRKTTKEFKQDVFDLVGDEYTVLGEYINTDTKILMKHNICKYEYYVTPNHFLRGTRCPKCFGSLRKTTKEFKQEVFNLVKNEYIVLGEYINNRTPILIKHNTCKNEFLMRPYDFINFNHRCPKCANKKVQKKLTKSTKQFEQEIYNLVGNEYEIKGKYINCHTKISILHKTCGNIYEVSPTRFLGGTRCPYCKRSKGEEIIEKFLKFHNIKYKTHISFSDCKYKRVLSYDFQIFLKDGNFILLEYNGKQHYENTFGYQEEFEVQQIRDQIKMNYCKKKGIPLYIIRYDENIEEKLEKILKIKL